MTGKTVKFDRGTIYRKTEKSNWYFRYQINGEKNYQPSYPNTRTYSMSAIKK